MKIYFFHPSSLKLFLGFFRFAVVGKQNRRDYRTIFVIDFDISVLTKFSHKTLATFGNPFDRDCLAHGTLVKKGLAARFLMIINAENVNAFINFDGFGISAVFDVFESFDKRFADLFELLDRESSQFTLCCFLVPDYRNFPSRFFQNPHRL